MEQNLKNARKTKNVKAMLVINPQDPIGEVMNYSQMSEIIDFCEKNKLVLIACESLQHSIYPQAINSSNTYVSFRHLVKKLNSNLELFSIQTLSQGPFFK